MQPNGVQLITSSTWESMSCLQLGGGTCQQDIDCEFSGTTVQHNHGGANYTDLSPHTKLKFQSLGWQYLDMHHNVPSTVVYQLPASNITYWRELLER